MTEENEIPDFFEEKDLFGQPKSKPAFVEIDSIETTQPEFPYATFGSRLLAYLLDALILLVPVYIARGFVFDNWEFRTKGFQETIFELTLWTFYYGVTESSIKQASLGKRLCNLKVIDIHGKRTSFLRASMRFLAMSISFLVVGLGIISILINRKRQGWHDMLTDCYVIKDTNNAA